MRVGQTRPGPNQVLFFSFLYLGVLESSIYFEIEFKLSILTHALQFGRVCTSKFLVQSGCLDVAYISEYKKILVIMASSDIRLFLFFMGSFKCFEGPLCKKS